MSRKEISIKRKKQGFSMLEVLIALLVLAIGLLGLAGLQMVNLKASYSAGARSQASLLTKDMLERIRADSGAAHTSAYDTSGYVSTTSLSNTAASKQKYVWLNEIKRVLPEGEGSISIDQATGVATVGIRWNESRGSTNTEDTSQTSANKLEFSLSAKVH